MARDRSAVFASPAGWYVAGMAGGDPIELPQSTSRQLPVGGIVRVRKAGPNEGTTLRDLGPREAVAVLRESVQSVSGRDEEERRLEGVLALGTEVRVGILTVRLGESPLSVLVRWGE